MNDYDREYDKHGRMIRTYATRRWAKTRLKFPIVNPHAKRHRLRLSDQ